MINIRALFFLKTRLFKVMSYKNSLPNIVRVIKSRRWRWAGHVARMGKGEVCTGFWWGNLRERDRWGDPGVDGRKMLGWIFRKWDLGVRTGLRWLRVGTVGGRL
jgi:hypothetical protein